MRCTSGGSRASSLSALKTHLWEETGPGEDAQSQAQISTTSGRQGRGQKDRKKDLGLTWSLLQDIVWKETVSAWHSLREGVECYPLLSLCLGLSRMWEGARRMANCLWSPCGAPQSRLEEPGCCPHCHPSPIIPGGTGAWESSSVSWTVNQECILLAGMLCPCPQHGGEK